MARLPTPSEVRYMVDNADDDLRKAMIVSSAVADAMSIVFIALRIAARKLPRIPFGAGDWWMIASFVLFLGTPITFAWTTKYGAGRHVILLTDPKAFSRLLLAAEIFYFTNIYTIKISLLYLYRRIFPQEWFKNILLAFGVLLTIMTLASVLVCLLQCIPLRKMWEPTTSGTCIEFGKFALAMACLNIATDVGLLATPLPVIWRLKIDRRKKWLVSLSFAVGGSACIVCLVRLLFVLRVASTPDPTWDSIPSGITSTFELAVGIFAASFPTYLPLYRMLFGARDNDGSGTSGRYGSRAALWKKGMPSTRSEPEESSRKGIMKMTTIRRERHQMETDEERLYTVGSEFETQRGGLA